MRRRIATHIAVLVAGALAATAVLQVVDEEAAPLRVAATLNGAGSATATSRDPSPAAADSDADTAQKSYGIYVGRELTEDGSVLLGGTGDEVSSHWLEIVPAADHPRGSTIEVGVTEEAAIPGELMEIPQARHTYRYVSMDYSDFEGFPPPLTNGGLNEHQVAIRDIWSPSRDELVEMTPTPQSGPQYSDLARIGLERARTARQAVQVMARLIDRYGYSTYGGNSHLVADERTGWVMLQFAGGKGLWVAERLRPDEVRMSYPGYIQEIPTDCADSGWDGDVVCSDDFVDFAARKGWWDEGEPFDVNEVYGTQGWDYRTQPDDGKYVAPATIEDEVGDMAPVSVEEITDIVRDTRVSSDRNGYGQVAHLRPGVDRDLARLWVSPVGSVTSPFVPYHLGVQSAPAEYRQHRYMTKDSGSTFLNPRFAPQEATLFAGRVFKRLMYHTCTRPREFYPEVREALTAFEERERAAIPGAEATARTLIDAGRRSLARRYLTEFSHTRAYDALDLGEALLASIEARVKLRYGIPQPPRRADINGGSSDFGGYVTCHRE